MKDNNNNTILFYKTQYSFLVIFGVLFCEAVFLAILYGDLENIFLWILATAFAVVALLYYRLDIILDHETLTISKGIGLISDEYPLPLLQSVVTQPNNNLFDWIYDPFSAECLGVKFRDGTIITIAIPERAQLQQLLRMKINA